jgi:predicted nucleic acid-binding Zn ribbon protein
MVEEPKKEELQEKIENMEKRYDEIIEKMRERYSQDLANILKHMKDDPVVICASCGSDIKLDPVAYWNVEDTDIKCKECGALMRITLEEGELKKS